MKFQLDTNELGQEIFSTRNHKNSLSDIAISNILSKAASCGDNAIKVHELADLRVCCERKKLWGGLCKEGISYFP